MEFYTTSELSHHGILGQKWGVRRYQNKDGSLTPAGRSRYGVEQLEKKAQKQAYKEHRKSGGGFLFRSARKSTGKNFDEAEKNFENVVLNDSKYKDLSKQAADAEKKRLLMEKGIDPNSTKYDKLINSKEYREATNISEKADRAKERRVNQLAKKYVDQIKEAKMSDLKIRDEDKEIVKQYLSGDFNSFVWDGNLSYNPDNAYYLLYEERPSYNKED